MRNVYKILVKSMEEKRILERNKRRSHYNTVLQLNLNTQDLRTLAGSNRLGDYAR